MARGGNQAAAILLGACISLLSSCAGSADTTAGTTEFRCRNGATEETVLKSALSAAADHEQAVNEMKSAADEWMASLPNGGNPDDLVWVPHAPPAVQREYDKALKWLRASDWHLRRALHCFNLDPDRRRLAQELVTDTPQMERDLKQWCQNLRALSPQVRC